MGLQDPFALRIAQIRSFMRLPPFRVLELNRPPDLEQLVQRVLARIADDPSDPHAHIYVAPEFTGYREFFQELVDVVASSVDEAGAELVELDCFMPAPPELSPDEEEGPVAWARTASAYLSRVGDTLPEEAGSLIVVVEPVPTTARDALGWCFGALAYWIESDRAKVVVVDGGPAPLVPVSDEVEPTMVRVDFAVPPEELESAVKDELARGAGDPAQAGRLRLLAGAFATSAGRFDEAERELKQALEAPAGERANALYNLGNLYARTHRYEEAAETLAEAAEEALASSDSPLAAMALTNLGLALYHEHRGGEALESLGAARKLFRALNHRPGEAHVVDCTAGIWVHSDPERARALWHEALALYDSISAPHLAEVRSGGRTDVLAKLERLPTASGDD